MLQATCHGQIPQHGATWMLLILWLLDGDDVFRNAQPVTGPCRRMTRTRAGKCRMSVDIAPQSGSHVACPRGTHLELVSGQGRAFFRRRRGIEQQNSSDHQTILRFSHLQSYGDCVISHTWPTSRTATYPQFLLRRRFYKGCTDLLLGLIYSEENARNRTRPSQQ